MPVFTYQRAQSTLEACRILEACGVAPGADFFTLSATTIDRLLERAKREHYRKPRNANGSRGRYYHDRLQRCARWQWFAERVVAQPQSEMHY